MKVIMMKNWNRASQIMINDGFKKLKKNKEIYEIANTLIKIVEE